MRTHINLKCSFADCLEISIKYALNLDEKLAIILQHCPKIVVLCIKKGNKVFCVLCIRSSSGLGNAAHRFLCFCRYSGMETKLYRSCDVNRERVFLLLMNHIFLCVLRSSCPHLTSPSVSSFLSVSLSYRIALPCFLLLSYSLL